MKNNTVWMTEKEVSDATGISMETLKEAREIGAIFIDYKMVNGEPMYKRKDVEDYMEWYKKTTGGNGK